MSGLFTAELWSTLGTFFTPEFLIALIASFPASVTFAIIFKINPRHLFLGGVVGVISYAVYYTVDFITKTRLPEARLFSVFLAALVSTICVALFAEIAAKLRRAPTIVFLVPGVIPTVPGGALYEAMKYMFENNWDKSFEKLMSVLLICLGIASGIVAVSAVYGSIKGKEKRKKVV